MFTKTLLPRGVLTRPVQRVTARLPRINTAWLPRIKALLSGAKAWLSGAEVAAGLTLGIKALLPWVKAWLPRVERWLRVKGLLSEKKSYFYTARIFYAVLGVWNLNFLHCWTSYKLRGAKLHFNYYKLVSFMLWILEIIELFNMLPWMLQQIQ
jgi:hypothetical protein